MTTKTVQSADIDYVANVLKDAGIIEYKPVSYTHLYRAPYILAAAKAVASGKLDPEKTGLLPCTEARAELKKLNGVGDKVANCVVLFGLHQLDAFPVEMCIRDSLYLARGAAPQ